MEMLALPSKRGVSSASCMNTTAGFWGCTTGCTLDERLGGYLGYFRLFVDFVRFVRLAGRYASACVCFDCYCSRSCYAPEAISPEKE